LVKKKTSKKPVDDSEMPFYDVRVNCEPCRRILAAMLKVSEDFLKDDESLEKDVLERMESVKYSNDSDYYMALTDRWIDKYSREEYPMGVTYTMLVDEVKMKKGIFLRHLKDHLLHYGILRKNESGAYEIGKNFWDRGTYEFMEYVKRVPFGKVKWHGGVGLINVPQFMDSTKFEEISKSLVDLFERLGENEKELLIVPAFVALDMKRVLASDKKRRKGKTTE
jgi:hypothetical protein